MPDRACAANIDVEKLRVVFMKRSLPFIFLIILGALATIPGRAWASPVTDQPLDLNDLTFRLLTSGTVSALPDLATPFLSLPEGTLMRSEYFYGPGATLSRNFQRGYMEFFIPPNLPDGFCATLNFRVIKGIGAIEVPPDLHELSHYQGSGFITTDKYNLPKTAFATFETDFHEPQKTVSVDVSSVVAAAEGRILGFEIRFLNNGSEIGSEDPFCFSDDPQSPTDLISHDCFVDNPLGSDFCGLDSKCGVDPATHQPITIPPRIDLDSDCDGILDDDDPDDDNDTIPDACDNCNFVANADQTNTDADLLGDACDTTPFEDVDGVCPCGGPLAGGPVNACSGPPFSSPWKNHGEYASCISGATDVLLAEGKITSIQKNAIMDVAGMSSCGKNKL